ncbi:AmmeMemoRadiSam system protein A [Fusibacter tunisiensis]|uniref:AmmeMemoRadiSam system protein A/AmmeMemoRadiSam system protein B n=1 Tax=Fusibacter tunisiensis TaxID=1008308 RepID=A0ABS2MQZ9_9FIRM|nr:AmmeMemoRadiSam system protein A [Fusibacter tunisiensis]MBM7561832.1 AmmeMemoRadiSam system protein A/AmmeMemoRadiSam system protein B [Fusibacter tunisiensis]
MSFLGAFLMPHAPVLIDKIGDWQTNDVQKTVASMKSIANEIAKLDPDTIIVISPHGPIFSDAIAIYNQSDYKGDFHAFGEFSLQYNFVKDADFIAQLIQTNAQCKGDYYPIDEPLFQTHQISEKLDHGVLVPLHFINEVVSRPKYVFMSYGHFSYKRLMENGYLLRAAIEALGKNIVVIASGDMSHALKDNGPYDYLPEGPQFDSLMVKAIDQNKPWDVFAASEKMIAGAKECGLRSYAMLLGLFLKSSIASRLYSYEGPFGVGYLCASFYEVGVAHRDSWYASLNEMWEKRTAESRQKEHPYVQFARAVIASRVKRMVPPKVIFQTTHVVVDAVRIQISNLQEIQSIKRACFVSIKQEGQLRGCIGTLFPVYDNLLIEIYHNAMAAATKDGRFYPIQVEELNNLTVSVDVLSDMERVANFDGLDPKKYGVYLISNRKNGVLLPDLEGIKTVEEQVGIAASKGGFLVEEIEEMYRFTVDRFS